ncbi:MAG TPA: hypothetical protein VI381_02580 [Allosphingosinicella sp.]
MDKIVLLALIVIGLPVVLGIGGDVLKRWLRLKEKQLDHAAQLAADKAVAQAAHIERLEQRMRVLERIATDKGGDLAAEIENLHADRVN